MEGGVEQKEEEPVLGCMMALLILILCVLFFLSYALSDCEMDLGGRQHIHVE